jgi:DNA-binding LytR/AlgR family response regulator
MTEETALNGLRVMVIEDDFYLAADTQWTLENAGASVVGPFPDAVKGIGALDTQPLDCAVLDINLGGAPSFKAATVLKQLDIPFVFITGYDANAIPPEFKHVERLEKPVDPRRLVQAVFRVCQRD